MNDPVDVVYSGIIFSIAHRQISRPDGSTWTAETVTAPDVVRVYPFEDSHVRLIREYRHEQAREVLRTVAGRVEPGERPEDAARRELREELGFVAERVEVFATSRPILKVESDVYHVAAFGLHEGQPHPEDDEQITGLRIPIDEVPNLVWDGSVIEDVIALNLLRLQRLWSSGRLTQDGIRQSPEGW